MTANASRIEPAPLTARVRQLIEDDDVAALDRCLAPPEVGELALEDRELEVAVVDALTVIHWSDPSRAASLYQFFARLDCRGEHHRRFVDIATTLESWIDVCKRAPCPVPLERLVRRARVVSEAERARLLAELHADVEPNRGAYERFFAGFDLDSDRALIAHLRVCLGIEGYPERIPIERRPVEAQRAASVVLRRANRAVRAWRRTLFVATFLAPIVIGGGMAALLRDPEWLGLISAAIGGNFWLLVLGAYKGGYRSRARPELFGLAVEQGIGEAAITRWVVDHRRTLRSLDAHESKLEDDPSLHLGALLNASAVGAEHLRALYGGELDSPPPLDPAARVALMTDEERERYELGERDRRRSNTRRDLLIFLAIFAGVTALVAGVIIAHRLTH